jgi:hypothetical protein
MTLTIWLEDVPIVFTEPRTGGAYDWLTSVGPLALAARAGHLEGIGIGETPNLELELDNTNRQASRVLGQALRARVDVADNNGDPYFSGLVASIAYGATTIALNIES